jgi:antitoxin component YwqK of YwqJK toxin-antitoxin module
MKILVLLLLPFISVSQTKDTIRISDDVICVYETKDGLVHGLRDFYQNDTLILRQTFNWGVRSGPEYWFKNGQLGKKIEYSEGARHGKWETFIPEYKVEWFYFGTHVTKEAFLAAIN